MSRIQIKKFTNGQDADTPTGPLVRVGDPVTWTYRVTNPGNVPIKNPRVTDNRGVTPGFIGGDADGDTDLDPGEAWTYMATGVGRAGQYSNVGTVSGLDVLENPVADSDPSHYLGRRCLPIPGDTTPPFLAVNARRNQLKSVALARGVHARIRTRAVRHDSHQARGQAEAREAPGHRAANPRARDPHADGEEQDAAAHEVLPVGAPRAGGLRPGPVHLPAREGDRPLRQLEEHGQGGVPAEAPLSETGRPANRGCRNLRA